MKFEIQVKFFELFSELSQVYRITDKKFFSIITTDSKSYIPTQIKHELKIKFTRFDQIKIFTDDSLKQIIEIACQDTHVFTSKMVGLGKSSTIKALAKEKKLDHQEVLVAGDVKYSNFNEVLYDSIFESSVLLHLSIGSIEDYKFVNETLQTLSLYKMILTKKGKFFLNKNSVICIEIENTENEYLKNSLHFLYLLEKKHKFIDRIRLEDLKIDAKVAHVSKYLHLYAKETLNTTDIYFGNNDSMIEEEYKLAIVNFFERKIEKLNFYQLKIFFNLLFQMITCFEKGQYQSFVFTDLVRNFKANKKLSEISKIYENIRSIIFKNLLDTTHEFTKRSLNEDQSIPDLAIKNSSNGDPFSIGKWDESNHFMLFFSETGEMSVIFKDIEKVNENIKGMITCQKFLFDSFSPNIKKKSWLKFWDSNNFDPDELKTKIKEKNFDLNNYLKLKNDELLNELVKILGKDYFTAQKRRSEKDFKNYVLTCDNFLKMIKIFIRSVSNIPIIIMGETGCGKTCLIKFLVNVVLQETLIIISVNAGTSLETITKEIQKIKAEASISLLKNEKL